MSDDAPYTRLALFGATGQIGASILNALLHPSFPGYEPHIKVFLRDESYGKKASTIPDHPRVEKVKADFDNVEELAEKLKGVEAVVSALNGPGIDAQYKILDACAEAGVKRFLPSEYGSEHPWRKPGDEWTHTHPYFDIKARFKEYMYLHPAMVSGKMTYTIVGVGDLCEYFLTARSPGSVRSPHAARTDDQPTENYWIAWAQQKLPDTYVFPVVADPSSKYAPPLAVSRFSQ